MDVSKVPCQNIPKNTMIFRMPDLPRRIARQLSKNEKRELLPTYDLREETPTGRLHRLSSTYGKRKALRAAKKVQRLQPGYYVKITYIGFTSPWRGL